MAAVSAGHAVLRSVGMHEAESAFSLAAAAAAGGSLLEMYVYLDSGDGPEIVLHLTERQVTVFFLLWLSLRASGL